MGQRLTEESGSSIVEEKLEKLPNWAPNTQPSFLLVEDIILAKCHKWNITL